MTLEALLSEIYDQGETTRARLERLIQVGLITHGSVDANALTCSVEIVLDDGLVKYDSVRLPFFGRLGGLIYELVDVYQTRVDVLGPPAPGTATILGQSVLTPPAPSEIRPASDTREQSVSADVWNNALGGRTVLLYTDKGAENAQRYIIAIY